MADAVPGGAPAPADPERLAAAERAVREWPFAGPGLRALLTEYDRRGAEIERLHGELRAAADALCAVGKAAIVVKPTLDKPYPDDERWVEVNRLTTTEGGPVTGYRADIRVQCAHCGEPFRWMGVPAGLLSGRPSCSVDESELRAPIRPASSDPDFGLGIPGFAVRWHGQEQR